MSIVTCINEGSSGRAGRPLGAVLGALVLAALLAAAPLEAQTLDGDLSDLTQCVQPDVIPDGQGQSGTMDDPLGPQCSPGTEGNSPSGFNVAAVRSQFNLAQGNGILFVGIELAPGAVPFDADIDGDVVSVDPTISAVCPDFSDTGGENYRVQVDFGNDGGQPFNADLDFKVENSGPMFNPSIQIDVNPGLDPSNFQFSLGPLDGSGNPTGNPEFAVSNLFTLLPVLGCDLFTARIVITGGSDSDFDGEDRAEVLCVLEPPPLTIECPQDITTECTGLGGAVVDYEVTVTTCDQDADLVCDPPSGSTFPAGTTKVTCTVTDSLGREETCCFNVTVTDNDPPTIDCPDMIVVDISDVRVPVEFTATATDLCDPNPDVVCDPPSGTLFHPGDNIVVCVATDEAGNVASCDFIVRVRPCVNVDLAESIMGPVPAETFITDQYIPLGIRMSGISDLGNMGVVARRQGLPGSSREDLIPVTGPNYMQTFSGGSDSDSGFITYEFVDPNSGTPLPSSFVQLTFLDIEDSGTGGRGRARLEAYDEGGALIETVFIPTGGNGNHFTAVIGALNGPLRIARAVAVTGDLDDSGGVDELCYFPEIERMESRLITMKDEIVAGEELTLFGFVRNGMTRDVNVEFEIRASLAPQSRGKQFAGPEVFELLAGADRLGHPKTVRITTPDDRPRSWDRMVWLRLVCRDADTGEDLGETVRPIYVHRP